MPGRVRTAQTNTVEAISISPTTSRWRRKTQSADVPLTVAQATDPNSNVYGITSGAQIQTTQAAQDARLDALEAGGIAAAQNGQLDQGNIHIRQVN